MRALILLTACSATLSAQAIIEYGITAGNSGAAGAAVGKSTVKILGQLDKTLANAARGSDPLPANAARNTAVRPGNPAPVEPAAPAPPADLTGIEVGMEKSDLIAKAGKPWMAISGMEKSTVTETLTYRTESGPATVVLRAGKVASITAPEASAAK
jgi:hypothetical protein